MKAAEGRLGVAEGNAGDMYFNGMSKKDMDLAIELYKKSAEQGYVLASTLLELLQQGICCLETTERRLNG